MTTRRDEIAELVHPDDEAAERPRVRTYPLPRVFLHRVGHRERRRWIQARVVDRVSKKLGDGL